MICLRNSSLARNRAVHPNVHIEWPPNSVYWESISPIRGDARDGGRDANFGCTSAKVTPDMPILRQNQSDGNFQTEVCLSDAVTFHSCLLPWDLPLLCRCRQSFYAVCFRPDSQCHLVGSTSSTWSRVLKAYNWLVSSVLLYVIMAKSQTNCLSLQMFGWKMDYIEKYWSMVSTNLVWYRMEVISIHLYVFEPRSVILANYARK